MQVQSKTKSFWMVPFIVHATRGIIRDQTTRRWTMFSTLLLAVLLLFSGSTLLRATLISHPRWFIAFWFVVAWLTLTAILLGFLDLVVVRAQARVAKRNLQGGFLSPRARDAQKNGDTG